jgi:hypothetical protein
MLRLLSAGTLLAALLIAGCGNPSDPSNAPPNYPDTTDPKGMSEMMGGGAKGAPGSQPGAPQQP